MALLFLDALYNKDQENCKIGNRKENVVGVFSGSSAMVAWLVYITSS